MGSMCNDDYHTDDFLQASYFLENEDYQKAFYFLKKGALQGDVNCYNNLAVLYDLGYGIEKNPLLALKWYRKSWQYEGKSGGVCSNIASLYAGLGNIRQAKFWWNKAILELNDGDAALDYAKFLINRKNKRDYHKIIELLKFAIKSDYITEISKEEAGQLLKNLEST